MAVLALQFQPKGQQLEPVREGDERQNRNPS